MMGSSNLPLIMWYAFCGIIGMILFREKRWLGLIYGLIAALVLITIFALLLGG